MIMHSVLNYERRKMIFSDLSTIALCAFLVIMMAFLGWVGWNYQRFPMTQIERLTKQEQTIQNLLHSDDIGEEEDLLYAIQNEITSLRFSYEQDEPIFVSDQFLYESLLLDAAQAGIVIDQSRTNAEIHLETERLKKMEQMNVEVLSSPYALNVVNLIVLLLKSGFAYGFLIIYLIYCAYVFGWEMDTSAYISLFTCGVSRRTIILAKMIRCMETLGIGILQFCLFFGFLAILIPFGNINMPILFDNHIWLSIQLVGQLGLNCIFVFLFLTMIEMVLIVFFLKQEMIVLGSFAIVLIGIFIHPKFIPISLIQSNDVVSMFVKGGLSVTLALFAWFWIKRKDLVV